MTRPAKQTFHPTDRAALFTWRRNTVIEYRSAWLQMSSYLALPW